jgi:glycosyltransferase involved in cell wall biosynthesis
VVTAKNNTKVGKRRKSNSGQDAPFSVAVVIPLFNKEAAIESTLQSVLSQTRAPDELILVDDGSTDRSAAIAEKLLASSGGTAAWRIVRQANAGEGAARNRGAQEATARYIAFLDADDEWLPDYLAELERLALAFPSASVLSIRNARRNAKGAVVPGPSTLGDDFFGIVDRPIDAFRRGYGILNSSSVAIRRDAWENCGGFEVGAPTGADVLLWLKLGLAETFAHSGRALSVWRDEYSAVASRKSTIPAQLRYFLGTAEGRRYIGNADLQKFLQANVILQIGVYSLIGDTGIRSELRQLSKCLPISARLKCWAATLIPPWFYRGIVWWRRRSREMASSG